MTITATSLTITIQLKKATRAPTTPTLGGDPKGHLVGLDIYSDETDGSTTSPESGSPTWKILGGSVTNTVTWTLGNDGSAAPHPTWWANTHIIGIVLERSVKADTNNPGGAGFHLRSGATGASYKSSPWAGPSAKTDPQATSEYVPWLLLASQDGSNTATGGGLTASTLVLNTINTQFYNGTTPKAPLGGTAGVTPFAFGYRIYFYTVGIGVWYDDPEFDLQPC